MSRLRRRKVFPGENERIVERRRQVWVLRKTGASYRLIAEQVNVSYETVREDVQAVLDELRAEALTDAEELRTLELARLDGMLISIAGQLGKGDLGAVDRALRVSESRRKLLGLDAPTKIAPTDPTGEKPYEPVDLTRLSLDDLHELQRLADKAVVAPGD